MTTKRTMRVSFLMWAIPLAAVLGVAIGTVHARMAPAPTDAPVAADDHDTTPVGNSYACSVAASCNGGCSISCRKGNADCRCVKFEVPCQGPYPPPVCYNYRPVCRCQ